ncbi:MAG TPA: hypothetical protein VHB02_19065 [Acidimicrobiales bacterium]|nr:hypothetical protein [Acidimicrobiales bacterium]
MAADGLGPYIGDTSLPLRRLQWSTPLDDGPAESVVPRPVLWAMKYHRHVHFGHHHDDLDERQVGEGDGAVYVFDDGANQCMAGRLVGSSPDGCTYCLVGTVDAGAYQQCAEDGEPTDRIFAYGRDLLLCAVYEGGDGPSNIVDVRRYRKPGHVPAEYLPPHPFIEFPAPLV